MSCCYEHTPNQNTVVVGQKVHAKIVTSEKVSVDTGNIRWNSPTGGSVVHNYETTNGVGEVTTLDEAYAKIGNAYNTDGKEIPILINTEEKR